MTIEEKISELKEKLQELGISQAEFARRYYTDKIAFGNDNDREEKIFINRFKKHLSRPPKRDTHWIEQYTSFLKEQDEFKKNEKYKPSYVGYREDSLLESIRKDSRQLSIDLEIGKE
ncbi:MAG: hypothetical protein AAF518_16260 [Spirochaetota bacterium]